MKGYGGTSHSARMWKIAAAASLAIALLLCVMEINGNYIKRMLTDLVNPAVAQAPQTPSPQPETPQTPSPLPPQEVDPEAVMRADPICFMGMGKHPGLEETDDPKAFGNMVSRSDIRGIEILDDLSLADENAKDVSEAGNGKVLAWVEQGDAGPVLCIAGNRGVIAPRDCSMLFAAYTNAEYIHLNGALKTDNTTDMYGMFAHCSSLKELDLSSLNTSACTTMGEMLGKCRALIRVNLDGFQTENVESMLGMFTECEKLERLDLSGFRTDRVTTMRAMFYDCKTLEQLDVSSFDTARVTDMAYMFSECRSLKQLDLSSFDTVQATDMTWMFHNCVSLKILDITDFDTTNVTAREKMFEGCRSDLVKLHDETMFED